MIRQEKEIKGQSPERKQKLSLFTYRMIVYTETPVESIKSYLN